MATPPAAGSELRIRLEAIGRELGTREAAHRDGVSEARRRAEALRARVADALEGFRAGWAASGAAVLPVELSAVRTDDKHARAVEFEVRRGRHVAVVTVKSRGEVTLVGPFRAGKTEGPCATYPFDAERELDAALAGFLQRFLEEATTP